MTRLIEMTPYRAGILLSIGQSDLAFERTVKSSPGGQEHWKQMDQVTNLPKTSAKCYLLPQGDSIIRLTQLKTPHDHGRLIHELLHSICHLFRKRGIPLTEESEEAHTYLLQHLYEEAVK